MWGDLACVNAVHLMVIATATRQTDVSSETRLNQRSCTIRFCLHKNPVKSPRLIDGWSHFGRISRAKRSPPHFVIFVYSATAVPQKHEALLTYQHILRQSQQQETLRSSVHNMKPMSKYEKVSLGIKIIDETKPICVGPSR